MSLAFDRSKKTDLTSSDAVACAIEINWFNMNLMDGDQIDLDLRVDCFEGKCTFYQILLFKYFTENREQWNEQITFKILFATFFVWTGIIFDYFHNSGK